MVVSIKKEIAFIEGFKRLKANENNPKYKEICDASNKRLHLQLGTLRRLEDQGIDKFNKTNQDNYKTLLKDITISDNIKYIIDNFNMTINFGTLNSGTPNKDIFKVEEQFKKCYFHKNSFNCKIY